MAPACDRNPLLSPGTVVTGNGVSAVVTPGNGSWIAQSGPINNTITVHFDASMDPASLAISGIMGLSTYAWSTTVHPDDTLNIHPSSSPPGTGATLVITCDTMEGGNITINRTYSIAESVQYVHPGNTTGPWIGTREEPGNNIQDAVANAFSIGVPAVVLVAEGTFTTSTTTLVTMAESVSLYGGYSATNWEVRNPTTYVTRLEDTRTSLGDTSPTNPIRVVEVPNGITNATVLDGFTIRTAPFSSGPFLPSAAGIFIQNASPVISNNVIISPDVPDGSLSNSIGITHITGGNPSIHHNTIALGTRGSAAVDSSNYGIYCSNGAAPNIYENTIHAGASTGTGGKTFGIFLSNCSGSVSHNAAINGGIGESEANGIYLTTSTTSIRFNGMITASTTGISDKYAFGVRLASQSHADVEGNTLAGFSADGVRCVMITSLSRPRVFSNYIDAGNNPVNVGIMVNSEYSDPALFTEIYNNVVTAGTGTDTTGIFVYAKNPRVNIVNNTIDGGGVGTFAKAIALRRDEAAGPETRINIINNNLFTRGTSANSYGVYEHNQLSNTNTLSNNNFFNVNTLYRDYTGVSTFVDIILIADLNGFQPDAIFNISEDIYPLLNAADQYRFTGNPDAFLFDTGGVDGATQGWPFITDRDGIARTTDWSIGAYEYD